MFDFSEAIRKVKQGKRVKRIGWNGTNQYIDIATNITFDTPKGVTLNAHHKDMGNKAIVFHGTSGIQVGWLASQADMLSEDWVDA